MECRVISQNTSCIGFRYCKKCDQLKPPRSHHCSICGKCVMRMDHHCPWMGNCVGLRTHKYFLCYLFWTVISCLHVGITSTIIIGVNADAQASIGKLQLSGLMAECLGYGVAFAVTIMFCIHHNLIAKNESTLEMSGVGPFKNNNPYDLGNWTDNYK